MAEHVYVVAHRVCGKWTVEILSDGSLYISSNYWRKKDRAFRIYPDTRLVDVACCFPVYLHRVVQDAKQIVEKEMQDAKT